MAVIGLTSNPLAAYRKPSKVQTVPALNRAVMEQTYVAAVRRNQFVGTSARSPVYPKIFVSAPQMEFQYFEGIGRTMRGGISY